MSGYVDCGCRDCMEIAIGEPGAMCSECEEAGCEPDSECCVVREHGAECGCDDCEDDRLLLAVDGLTNVHGGAR